MEGLACAFAALHFALDVALAAHYQKPCASDEVQGEVQGETGTICTPKCSAGSYGCPSDAPDGAMAQPQCMLQDVNKEAYCALLCQEDPQCPSGATCRYFKQSGVGVCMYPTSFTDWAHQGTRVKLMIGWPSKAGQSTASFKIAKAYASLQSLKQKYGIEDGDADVLVVKELLSSLTTSGMESTSSGGGGASSATQASRNPGGHMGVGAFEHDASYFARNLRDGLPGLQREMHDTMWNIENIEHYGAASSLLRGIIVVVFLYLVGGSAMKYQGGARGPEVIPHLSFWMEYPKLVVDGMLYSKQIVCEMVGMGAPAGGGWGQL